MTSAHTPIYLDTSNTVDAFFASIANARILALDTEGASFHRFVDRIYLLQLSTREQSAIIDPLPIGEPAGLGALLEDPAVEIVFHDADYDLRLLHQDYGWHVRNIFDTRVAAQLLGIRGLRSRRAARAVLRREARQEASARRLVDAAADAGHARLRGAGHRSICWSFATGSKAELERTGRWEWAREEFALLEGTRWSDDDAANAFLRIKGARDLTRRELAMLRELVPWRDAIAGELDRATFRVVGQRAASGDRQRSPPRATTLGAIKGMPRGILESRGSELLDAVKRGLAVPEADLPRFPKAQRWDRDPDFDTRVNALKTARDAAADASRSRSRRAVLARSHGSRRAQESVESRGAGEVPELRRWQARELGEAFVKALVPHRKTMTQSRPRRIATSSCARTAVQDSPTLVLDARLQSHVVANPRLDPVRRPERLPHEIQRHVAHAGHRFHRALDVAHDLADRPDSRAT